MGVRHVESDTCGLEEIHVSHLLKQRGVHPAQPHAQGLNIGMIPRSADGFQPLAIVHNVVDDAFFLHQRA